MARSVGHPHNLIAAVPWGPGSCSEWVLGLGDVGSLARLCLALATRPREHLSLSGLSFLTRSYRSSGTHCSPREASRGLLTFLPETLSSWLSLSCTTWMTTACMGSA